MKSVISSLLVICLLFFPVVSESQNKFESDSPIEVEEIYKNFKIYTESGDFLTEKQGVAIGDIIIDANFCKFKVIEINQENYTALAKFIDQIEVPNVDKNQFKNVAEITINKNIGLYSTHNDESYILGDGTESVYGKGGIHDIGNLLKAELEKKKINVEYDETLHIPHDSTAYSRSRKTANKLLSNGMDAIFDIHRDGASRSFYLVENNGKKYSKVRIVVGQNNSNKDVNLQLAVWLTSVAKEMYPWLIADIYYGSGKYNQDLSSKALLFEMGCHKIEKDYVKNTVPFLADVITTTLFGTTIEEESGDLTIGGKIDENNLTVDEFLENKQNQNNFKVIMVSVLSLVGGGLLMFFVMKTKRNKKS